MFDPTDPRATLALNKKVSGPFQDARLSDFNERTPDDSGPGFRAWYESSTNLILRCVVLDGTASFARTGQLDEYVVFTLDARVTMDIDCCSEPQTLSGNRLAIVPPGDSTVTLTGQGVVTFVFTARAPDLAALCPPPERLSNIPPFQPWPDPPGGYRLRSYDLNVAPQPGRFGRIYRCTTMMVNVLDPREGPRDLKQVSPHHHDQFEQVSVGLVGEWRYLFRWPWTSDMTQWRNDEALDCGSPSVCVIPPPTVHTTLSTGSGRHQLIDIFSPPRTDFSEKSGWVLNADDYPMPMGALT